MTRSHDLLDLYIQVYTIGLMLLYEVCDAFEQSKLRYAVIGGYALALHGLVRATIDIDFVLKINLKSFKTAETCLSAIGLKSRIPVRAEDVIKMRQEFIRERNLLAWSFVDYQNPTRQIDILITKDISDLKTELVSVAGRRIRVASLDSLLALKEESGRPQDKIDIENIRRKIRETTKKS